MKINHLMLTASIAVILLGCSASTISNEGESSGQVISQQNLQTCIPNGNSLSYEQVADINGPCSYKICPPQDHLSGLNLIPAMRQVLQTKYQVSNPQRLDLYIVGYLSYQCRESSIMGSKKQSSAVASMNKWRVVSSPAASHLLYHIVDMIALSSSVK
mgnify:FL=1|jgi:hypothetical protein